MNLTRGQWVTIGAALGAVILSAIFHIGIREWYQPDVRYEEGSWYRSSGLAVGSLKLHNIGHSDAEEIQITAVFSEQLTDIATSAPGTSFKVIAGGIGDRKVTGIISRLVPDEAVYVYFAIKNPPVLNLPSSFVSSIKFKGGKGKAGQPIFPVVLSLILGSLIGIPSALFMEKVLFKTRFESHYRNLEKSIQLGVISENEGLSEDELKERMEEEFKNVSFRKSTLFRAGISAYKAAKSGKFSSN